MTFQEILPYLKEHKFCYREDWLRLKESGADYPFQLIILFPFEDSLKAYSIEATYPESWEPKILDYMAADWEVCNK